MVTTRDFNRLADYATARRVQLKLDRTDVAARMGKAPKTVERIENGKSVRAETWAALETALGWKPGSARAILGGGEPELIGAEPDVDPDIAIIRRATVLPPETRDRLEKLLEADNHRNQVETGTSPNGSREQRHA